MKELFYELFALFDPCLGVNILAWLLFFVHYTIVLFVRLPAIINSNLFEPILTLTFPEPLLFIIHMLLCLVFTLLISFEDGYVPWRDMA